MRNCELDLVDVSHTCIEDEIDVVESTKLNFSWRGTMEALDLVIDELGYEDMLQGTCGLFFWRH